MNQDWISIAELVVLIITLFAVVPQIILLRRQIKQQHEEHRRENTIQLMTTWCNSVRKDTCIAEQVARKLNTDQCKCLYNHAPFNVGNDTKKEICKFCPLDKQLCSACSLQSGNTVDGKILTELRWHVITYLNMLETVLVSWQLGIVDRDVIEEQFSFIQDADKGSTLAEFRHTAGGFPVTEAFIDTIKKPAPEKKKKLK